ncbi:unnamed protein product, partial [Vitis vinifera]|uniref:Uncharacterized protein n=1 Tax=Vitis vinifera TaxID=29760 RepID=D7U5F0_VITVI
MYSMARFHFFFSSSLIKLPDHFFFPY